MKSLDASYRRNSGGLPAIQHGAMPDPASYRRELLLEKQLRRLTGLSGRQGVLGRMESLGRARARRAPGPLRSAVGLGDEVEPRCSFLLVCEEGEAPWSQGDRGSRFLGRVSWNCVLIHGREEELMLSFLPCRTRQQMDRTEECDLTASLNHIVLRKI